MRPAAVVDASVMTDALVEERGRADELVEMLRGFGKWIAPHHLDLECANAWRGMVFREEIQQSRMSEALAELAILPVRRRATFHFHERIDELLVNVTPYDAAYVVLAEAYQLPLLTTDARLARAPGPQCEFIVC